VDREAGTDQFHDSDMGDVFDLYNACNGAMRGGLLDVRKLDELTPDEVEVLDVRRLREVWAHTASGCPECKFIVATLNVSRGNMRSRVGDSASEKNTVI
jgi:hypothetical protein